VDRPLRELIDDCAMLRVLASAAIDNSKGIMPTVAATLQTSLDRRLASRAHLLYARLDGTIEGNAVAAVVRTTGEVVAGKELLSRAQIVVSMGDTFDGGRILASLDEGPVTSALTFMRAMDRVDGLELALRRGDRDRADAR
jgi:hypothetical protein